MSTVQIFLLVTAAAAAFIGAVAGIVVLRDRRRQAAAGAGTIRHPVPVDAAAGKYDAATIVTHDEASGTAYAGVLRILWWLTIAVVLVGVGVSGAYASAQTIIFAIGGGAVIAVIALHELLPTRRRTSLVLFVEALVALALVTGLVAVTGYGASPFFFGYAVVAVAAALAHGGRVALAVAALATMGYVGVLYLDPAAAAWTGLDLLRFGLNIGSVWLLAYLAAVFSAQERRVRARVLELSRTDPLTTLFNRSQLAGTLEQEVSRTRRSDRGFCLLMIDLDGLKSINDSLGHHRGDDVLRAVGGIIRSSIRTVDTAYRFGGDEFLVLLPETDIAGAFVVAEKIRVGTEEVGLAIAGTEGATSVSIGLVSHPEDGLSAEELMIAADRAMYQAKSLGKNQISGNPRPRRLTTRVPVPPAPPAALPHAEAAAHNGAAATEQVAIPIEPEVIPEPVEAAAGAESVEAVEPEAAPVAASVAAGGDEEPDPSDVRRHMARASRGFDPDDQIRRAMDAFLSTPRDPGRGPDA